MSRLIRTSRDFHCTQSTTKKTVVRVLFVVVAAISLLSIIIPYTRSERAYAATNSTLNFQARILTSGGAVIPDGSYNVKFRIYDGGTSGGPSGAGAANSGTGGVALWTETWQNSASNGIVVKDGYITASLGSITSFPNTIPWDQELWITMDVGGTSGGASPTYDGEMLMTGSKRIKITAVPYAFRAAEATVLKTVNGANVSTLGINTPTGGSQTFQLQDQGVAGTFNLALLNSGAAQTFSNVNTFSAAGTALQVTHDATIGGTLGVTGLTTATGGLSTGAGSTLTVGGATLNNTLAIGDKPTGGNIGTAAATVDIYTNITVAQTTAGQTLTIPAPTTTTSGRIIYVTNIGSAGYTMAGSIVSPGVTMAFVWNNTTSSWSLVTSGTSGSYIQNGTSVQTANFNIQSNATTDVTATIQGANSQSANILEVKAASIGNPLFSVGNTGAVTFQNSTDSTAAFSVKKAGGSSILSVDTSNGTVGIGAAPTTSDKLYVSSTGTTGLNVQNSSSTSTGGTREGAILQSTATGTSTDSIEGVLGYSLSSSSATISSAVGGRFVSIANGGTITNAYGVQSQVNIASGTITNAYGVYVNASAVGAGITNNYGLYIEDQTPSGGTLSYNVYSAGATAKNYFAGYLQSGTSVQSPLFDTASATALNIGTTNATQINLNKNTQIVANLTVTNAGNVAFQRNTTDITATGTQTDLSLGTNGVLYRFNNASPLTINTLAGGADGRIITLVNAGSSTVTLVNNGSGTASNKIITGTGADVVIPAGASLELVYDSGASVWRVSSGAVAANGGYIQLQSTTPGTAQTGNFNISGTGIADILQGTTKVLTPLVDAATASTALNIGTTNASVINLNQDTTLAAAKTLTVAGNANFNQGATYGTTFTSDLTGGSRSTPVVSINQANDATNSNTSNLLKLQNQDSNSTAAALQISQVSAGKAINITGITTGTAIDLSGTNLTTGTDINLDISSVSSGQGIVVGGTNAGITTAFTGTYLNINPARTLAAASSITDTGNFLNINRSNTVTNAGGTYTVSGALANLQSNCTQTAGTCTDSANILSLNQQYANASGVVLNLQNSGVGNGQTISLNNASGTQANGLLINRNTAGGTTTSLLNLTNTAGTATNGIIFNGTIGTDITTAAARNLNIVTGTTGQLNLDSGTTGAINIGTTNANNKTIQIGNNTNAVTTTINIGNNATASSSTSVVLGSTVAGSTTIQNAATINLNAGTIVGNATTQTLFNTVATTVNAFGAATTLNIGNNTSATQTVTFGGTAASILQGANNQAFTVQSQGTGAVTVASGAASGSTGAVTVKTGNSSSSVSGAISIQTGTTGSGFGSGAININTGAAGATGTAGNFGGSAGAISLTAGNGGNGPSLFGIDGGGGNGGSINLTAGNGGNDTNANGVNGLGGSVNLIAGTGSVGGNVVIAAGSTTAVLNDGLGGIPGGGNVTISAGDDTFNGLPGNILLQAGAGTGGSGGTIIAKSIFKVQTSGGTNMFTANVNPGTITVNNASTIGTVSIAGGIATSQLGTPSAPTLATVGTAGATSYTYKVTALDGAGETLPSTGTTIATGNATLNVTNYIRVTWTAVSGASSYKIYRTASGGTPATTGLIGTVAAGTYTFNDTGIAATTAAPTANTTGSASFAGNVGINNSSAPNKLSINALTTADATAQVAISTGGTSNSGLIIQGVASQSAPLQIWQSSTGNQLAFIQSDGSITAKNAFFSSMYSGSVGLTVKAAASATADLLQLTDSSNNVNAAFNNAGNQLTLGRIAASGTVTQGKLVLGDGTTSNFGLTLQSATLSGSSKTITFPDATGTVCLDSGNCATAGSGYVLNQSSSPGTAQTGNINMTGNVLAAQFNGASIDTQTISTLSVGTANASGVTIGSTNVTSFQALVGNTGTVTLGGNSQTGATTIGGTLQTGITTLGQSTATNTINIGNANTTNGNTQTINIGAGTPAGTGNTLITVGNNLNNSAVTLVAGTGNINLNAGTIASNASSLNLFNTPTTISALQAATSISLGATTGTFSVRNANTTIGNAAGSGVFTNNGATLNTEKTYTNFATGGAIDTAANSVDKYTYFSIRQTTAGQTITIPTPTTNPTTIFGRIIYVSNIGTTAFTLGGTTLNPGTTATLIWSNTDGAATGGESWQFAGADGNGILNQSAVDQAASFRISGTGSINGTSATAFRVQNASSADTMFTVDTSNNRIKVGNDTAAASANTTAFVLDSASTANQPAGVNGAMFYDTTKGHVQCYEGGAWGDCGNTTLQNAYNNSTGTNTPEVILDNTRNGLDIQDRTAGSLGSSVALLAVRGVATATTLGASLFQVSNNSDSPLVGIGLGTQTPTTGIDMQFGGSANRTIQVLQNTTANLGGSSLTVQAGGANTAGNGGATYLNGGTGIGTGATYSTGTIAQTANAITGTGTTWTTGMTGGTIIYSDGTSGIFTRTGNTTGTSSVSKSVTAGASYTIRYQDGGSVFISGGTSTGGGAQGLVNLSSTTFVAASATQSFAANGSLSSVDNFSTIVASATNTSLTITVPAPAIAVVGRILYVSAANGSNDFALSLAGTSVQIAMKANSTATLIWNGTGWTAAGASSSTTLQAAYDNTLVSAGGAEILLNSSAAGGDGLTIRNNTGVKTITGALLEVQTSVGSNLFSVNNNATEYANNGGAETTTFTMWPTSPTGGSTATITRDTTVFATGIASTKVVTTGATTANQGVANTLAAALTANLQYTVSFAVKGTTSLSTLDVYYSKDGTNTSPISCSTGNTVTVSGWTRIGCTFTAPASGITSSNAIFIRQSNSNSVAATYYVDNLSVTVNASVNHAVDGSVDSALGTNWTAIGGSVARDTTTIFDTSGSLAATTGAAGRGVYNNLANGITPAVSTQYRVSFYARGDGTNAATIAVNYSRDGGSTLTACQDYNTQTAVAATYTLITCYFTTDGTAPTAAQLRITQTGATPATFYVDSLNVTLNNNNASNVQIGGGSKGGPTTLLTLDRSSTAPIAANNDAYLGSMYYDTSTGRIQCYEADGWGACGSAPDNIVNLNPEYAGAVLNGGGVGTMTADLCANSGALSVNSTLCASGQSLNFYRWTSPQATQQTYSIYVNYQLPSTFKSFASDNTVQLTGRVDSTTNAAVTYQMYVSHAGSITQCGTSETNVITTPAGGAGSANTWYTYGINGNESTGCPASGGDYIIFKINLKANSSANAYVSTLSFTTTGK